MKIIHFPFMIIISLLSLYSIADESENYPDKLSEDAQLYRGSIVFQHYCMQCHGKTGEGDGIRAKLYNPPPFNLTTSTVPDSYKETIIRFGGKKLGRSEFMPPWGEELTDEQIGDVVVFLRSIVK